MKATTISIIAAILLILGSIYLSKISSSSESNQLANLNNVSIVDGKQIIEIDAKGGYLPRRSTAKAGIPTIIRFNTHGTFDCSASVRIPSMNISKILPQSGVTDIDIGNPVANNLQGSCGMGMYPFEINFQS